MAFFKREVSPVERFETMLKEKQAARQKLAGRLGAAEAVVTEKRTAAEKLAVAGAATAQLERAEASLRTVEERARTLRAEFADLDEQVAATERALTEARAQRDRDSTADGIEAMAAAIEKAVPNFQAGTVGLLAAVAGSKVPMPEATKFSDSVEAVRREVLAAAELLCWELRSAAMRTRVGNANEAQVASEPVQPPAPETERQLIYTLNALSWREGGVLRSVGAFTVVGLPKALLAVALRHQHVDYINARRVQTLMHVHGNGHGGDAAPSDVPPVDLDLLAASEQEGDRADVA
jgi:G3E family GTPase